MFEIVEVSVKWLDNLSERRKIMFCNNSGKELKEEYSTSCGKNITENVIEKSVTSSEKLWQISKCMGILSSIIALLGCFFPFVNNNFLGKNYIGVYVEDYGAIVVTCFLAAMVFSFLGLYRNLTVVLIGSILTIGVTFWGYTSLEEDVTPAVGFYLVVSGVILLLSSVILGYLSHCCVKQSIVGNGCAIALAIIAGLGIYLVFHQSGGVNGEITLHNKSEVIADEEIEQVRNIAYQYLQCGLDGDIDGIARISMDEKDINEASIKVTHQYVEYYDNVELYVYQGYKEDDYLALICYDTKFYGVDTTTKSSQYIYLRENSQKKIKMLSMNKDLSEEEWEYVGEVVEENQELADEINAQFDEELENNIKLKETWEEIQEKLQ